MKHMKNHLDASKPLRRLDTAIFLLIVGRRSAGVLTCYHCRN